MKRLAVVLLLMMPSLLQAGGGPSRIEGCSDCHLMDKAKIGPSFQAVADRYRGDPEAVVFVAKNIKYGVKGKWGKSRHPALLITEKRAMKLAIQILAMEAPVAAPAVPPEP